jgi:cystathionine beta-lyase/cystathionine gamma-synthase
MPRFRNPRSRVIDPTSGGYFDADERRRAGAVMDGELEAAESSGLFVYARFGNVTLQDTEAMLTAIEGPPCSWSVTTSSGMAAIDLALGVFQAPGQRPWLVASELYGGTSSYIDRVLREKRGVEIVRIDISGGTEGDATPKLVEAIREHRPSLVLFEPVTNPLLIVLDAAAVIEAGREVGAIVVVDNTFATPALVRPLALGADLVVHSATKFLSGHGDVTAGVVSGAEGMLPDGIGRLGTGGSFRDVAHAYRRMVGGLPGAFDAYRLGTQLKTFHIRMERQMANAARLAALLDSHPKVARVFYPGLERHPTHAQARRLFGNRGHGAMITFDLGTREAAHAFMDALDHSIEYRPTLGDVDSILLHVPEIFQAQRHHQGMIRLSVGIEAPENLERAIGNALERA